MIIKSENSEKNRSNYNKDSYPDYDERYTGFQIKITEGGGFRSSLDGGFGNIGKASEAG